jgi:hypothetical protein
MWRKRAEAHGAVTLNLLALLRTARNQVSQMQREQKEVSQRYNVLKRKFDEDELSGPVVIYCQP